MGDGLKRARAAAKATRTPANTPVRVIGTVKDSEGRDVPVGVDHDHVTIGDRMFSRVATASSPPCAP